jgi:glycosyltransferase involved in cell wall biosynthesis
MRVSVALPTYNAGLHLREHLESLSHQTRCPDELVVTDDASTDDTLAIVDKFASGAHFPVHVHSNRRNIGLSRNTERALSLTSGDLVFMSHQDDIWLPAKIEAMTLRLEKRPAAQVAICDQHVASYAPSGAAALAAAFHAIGLRQSYYAAAGATAVRRSFLDVLLPLPDAKSLPCGIWLLLLATVLDTRIEVDETLQRLREHRRLSLRTGRPVLVAEAGFNIASARNPLLSTCAAMREAFDLLAVRVQGRASQLEALGLRANATAALDRIERQRDAVSRFLNRLRQTDAAPIEARAQRAPLGAHPRRA